MTARTKKPEAPKRNRQGYYVMPTGEKLLSVTNIKKFGVPTDLTGWAGWEAGLCAVDSIPRLSRLRGESERRRAAAWIGKASDRIRDTAGELGSAVHDAIEAHILGKPVPEPTSEQKPFMDAFFCFEQNERPAYEATEMVLANPADGWAGTGDVWLTLPNIGPGLYLGDWKSSRNVHADFALQLAAYQRATVGWLRDGTEVVPPKTEQAVIIHLRPDKYPDTGYRIVPLDTSDAVYESFLDARRVAVNWSKGLSESVLGEPYEPVIVAEEVA